MLLVYRGSIEAFITGVGRRTEDSVSWTAPRDPSLRWDTNPESNDQLEVSGIHAFLLHDACWKLLQKASERAGLSLERLVSVCEALPFPVWYSGLSWGHDYGGLLKLDVDNSYPWLERFDGLSTERIHDFGGFHDPFDGIDFPTNLSTPVPLFFEKSSHVVKRTDCFFRLPWELRELITMSLPTESALNLRQASWSFCDLFSSRAFWLSRFGPNGGRDYMFEVRERENTRNATELMRLYRSSKCSVDSPSLLNRKRVWTLARRLAPIIEPSCLSDISVRRKSSPDREGYIRLAGQEQPSVPLDEWKPFDQGCRSITTTDVDIPYGPLKIGITIADMGDWDYVTGIRLMDRNGDEQIIGYRSNENEIVCDVTALQGFKVAMGPGGVRALQVIGHENQASGWVGRIDEVPRSERLMSDAPISSLSVSFDVSEADLLTKLLMLTT